MKKVLYCRFCHSPFVFAYPADIRGIAITPSYCSEECKEGMVAHRNSADADSAMSMAGSARRVRENYAIQGGSPVIPSRVDWQNAGRNLGSAH